MVYPQFRSTRAESARLHGKHEQEDRSQPTDDALSVHVQSFASKLAVSAHSAGRRAYRPAFCIDGNPSHERDRLSKSCAEWVVQGA